MKQRSLAIVSTALGVAAFALVGLIQANPLTLTRGMPPLVEQPPKAQPEVVRRSEAPPAQQAATTTAHERPHVIELQPIHITAARRAPATASRPAAPDAAEPNANAAEREVKPLEPCTSWRELGPAYVNDGQASGVRRVRDLC
jgi:hypothetical protein